MLTLYFAPGASSFAVHIALHEIGLRISFCLNDIGLPSKATPISCRAMCTAKELAPGAK